MADSSDTEKNDDGNELGKQQFELAKRKKTNARTAITKEINAFYKLMRKDENYEQIEHRFRQFDNKCDELKTAFAQYIALVNDAKKVEEETARQNQILRDVNDFYEDMDAWMKEAKEKATHADGQFDVLVQRVVDAVSKKLCSTTDVEDPKKKAEIPAASETILQKKEDAKNSQLNVTAPSFQPISTTTTHQASSGFSPVFYQQPTALYSHLPPIEMTKFSGDPIEYNNFIKAFNTRVVSYTQTNSDRLFYLHQSLDGEPKELISGCLYMDDQSGYDEALRLLQEHYGRSMIVANSFISKLQKVKPIKADDVEGLKQLYLLANKCLCAMKCVNDLSVLDFPVNLQMVIVKLPPYMQNKWRDVVARNKGDVHFADLVNLLRSSSDAANNPFFGKTALDEFSKGSSGSRHGEIKNSKASTFATDLKEGTSTSAVATNAKKRPKCWFCDKEGHYLDDCRKFRSEPFKSRREFVQSRRLCFLCLGSNHVAKECKRKKSCSICLKGHPTALHCDKEERSNATDATEIVQESSATIQFASKTDDDVMHSILPVKVSIGDRTVVTYAFYDNGSSASFISESLKKRLRVSDCATVALRLFTMHGSSVVESSLVRDVIVQSYDGRNPVQIKKAYVKDVIPVSSTNIPRKEFLEKHSELKKFSSLVPEFLEGVDIGLLIGCNCPKALEPLRVISSTDGTFACQLRHGWVVNGPQRPGGNHNASSHRIMIDNVQVKELPVPEVLSLKNQEADFRFGSEKVPDERGWSQEDRLFMEKMKNGTVISSGHYEIPLPFRSENVSLPSNKAQAVQRALCLSKKLSADKNYCNEYSAFMSELLEKGYAERVPSEELHKSDGKVWYLPHHGVRHPQKQTIRVVFDCSAESRGTSLNSQLLSGPNLNNSLVGVLTRFREGEVCFLADVEKMFYQVRVPACDRDYLRFLWWPEGDISKPLAEFRMTVHIFGAASSPSVCVYALQRVPDDYDCSKEAATTIRDHFYVDDCLRSIQDASEASRLIKEVTDVCSCGGFHLHKFVSNSVEVLKTIPQNEMAKDIQNLDFDVEPLPSGRTLGLQWCVSSDEFRFSFNPKKKVNTRRGLLSVISSVYDPLGLVSPIILPAKLLLQELCRVKLGWDDDLPEPIRRKWEEWVRSMSSIVDLHVRRCVMPSCCISASLCVFSDASSDAYGAVAYLRVSEGDGVKCFLLMGKARVKPLKNVTIPRMELTAAIVALKLGSNLSKELSCQPAVTYFTDSTSVLHFLRNTKKRFSVFVANRVQIILDFSSASQWRFVPSRENPADLASRGMSMQSEESLQMWLHGPPFLLKHESEWPKDPCVNDKDVEGCFAAEVEPIMDEPFDTFLSHYSDFLRMKRAVCVFLRVFEILKFRVSNGRDRSFPNDDPLFSVSSLEKAENVIVRRVQVKNFSKEVIALKESKPVGAQSPLFRLDPFCENGILRVGGRLKGSSLPEVTKHQVLLPRKGHVTTVIIRSYHESLQHAGRNHVHAALREKFWIIHGNAAVRSVLWHCVVCRRMRGAVADQKMANLPIGRMSVGPPFEHTGVDLFGPFHVKCGRKECKRYGVLFTCLSCRAIHLEVVHSLEKDAFINALRRFIARRGPVKAMYCDNGTNLVGTERELHRAVNEHEESLRKHLLSQAIDWNFNPPEGSHMGGSWERLIRSVRSVLNNLLREFGSRLNDETLFTMLCEAEAIVNSRPLTCISDSTDDLNPLTPNLLLTLKDGGSSPAGVFQREDVYSRKRWRQVQYLSNLFCSRWKREFLMMQQMRQKWATKKRNLRVGDVIIVKDEDSPHSSWPLARVVGVKVGTDDLVRSVVVKTASSELRRPAAKCVVLLPIEEQS